MQATRPASHSAAKLALALYAAYHHGMLPLLVLVLCCICWLALSCVRLMKVPMFAQLSTVQMTAA
jgi:hypothetical protein